MSVPSSPAALEALRSCAFDVEGRVFGASNATLRCTLETGTAIVYKPQRGERPLWDFPEGTLTGREIASFEIDRVLGFDLIPPTVWRDDGPAGAGMIQSWVAEDDEARLVDVVPPDEVPAGWLTVLRASDGLGNPLMLVHADDVRLQRMAVLDAVLNNGDRKGGHVITDVLGGVWGVDHGVTLSVEPKLRTVLWGWAEQSIAPELLSALETLYGRLTDGLPEVERWLNHAEVRALRDRVADLLRTGSFPAPSSGWPAIPWPVF
jgi:uncharacterized repeat protein (TIGR03843 family)